MILRHISSAIRRQDWFTVLIEVAIVVVGLLIGLQINNWNEARADRAKEVAFLERLATDVDLARDRLTNFIAGRTDRLASITKMKDILFAGADPASISEADCTHLGNAHIVTHPPVAVPSITEAFAGGKMDLIRDASIVRQLIAVEQDGTRMSAVIDDMQTDRPDLTQKYPEAISWEPLPNTELSTGAASGSQATLRIRANCHFLATPPKPEFASDVVRGLELFDAYVFILQRHMTELDALAAILEGKQKSEATDLEETE